jgi:hypothetical protein
MDAYCTVRVADRVKQMLLTIVPMPLVDYDIRSTERYRKKPYQNYLRQPPERKQRYITEQHARI